jgi:hypothetical protein
MLLGIATVIIALVIASIMLTRHRPDPAQLNEPRGSLPMMGIQIVCGNCAGDELRPRRTYLDRFGSCSQCGGQSYLLASSVYGYPYGKPNLEEVERIPVNARVLAFDSARAQSARVQKVAV